MADRKLRRCERARNLLAQLSHGPVLTPEVVLSADAEQIRWMQRVHRAWFRTLREEFIQLQPELSMSRRVFRECLKCARWPIDKPFLTPREFTGFTRLLHARRCEVTTTDGRTLTGLLNHYDGGSIGINRQLLRSDEVADLVCVDGRTELSGISTEMASVTEER